MFSIFVDGFISPINHSSHKGVMTTQMTIRDILQIYALDSDVNRDLNSNRIPSIVKYLENSNTSPGIYFPSFVFSYRHDLNNRYNKEKFQLEIKNDEKMIVIDGQHRISALKKFVGSIDNDSERNLFQLNNVTVQIYFGLSIEEERKLFSDINSNAKRVSTSLVTLYDTRDILNVLVKELYKSCSALNLAGIELNKNKVVRPGNTSFSNGVRLKKFITFLLFGKRALNSKEEQQVRLQYDEILSSLIKFFNVFFSVLPSVPGDVDKYLLGHEALQNAIAQYLNKEIIIQDGNNLNWVNEWENEVEQLQLIDWTVQNSDWNKWTVTLTPTKGSTIKGFAHPYIPELIDYIRGKIQNSGVVVELIK
ncbi:DGQHR domain-containing protein [Brevibacillus borstelensis]|uniref:DNA sulfur modification protein DndB n=1 Tax=Brevibacillus borstelensis TaxID=45462 RepID=UPI00068AD24B|nr:DNA sulfur modification protein DndB [Brevibacillus borstelensis]MBE5397289.1 DGQHR domain-containing protein [Brevibacillus borstelensis]